MPDIRDTIRLIESAFGDELKNTHWSQALPEMRWVNRGPGVGGAIMTLQQRWRIITEDGKEPRHEWRDVPTVKEES